MPVPTEIVSVIVPTKNSERYLARCLASICAQTYPLVELIVVDNYSSDSTVAIASQYGAQVVSRGPERSAQVNEGARRASGAYLYRVDADFELDPTVIDEAMELARLGHNAVVIHNTAADMGLLSRIRKFEVDCYKFSLDHSAARFFERGLFEAVGGYCETVTAGEDYDLQNRLIRSGARIGFCVAEARHLDEPTTLRPLLHKYFRYGKDFRNYLARNADRSSTQLAFVRSDFLRHWRRFVRHPVLGLGVVGYHTAKYAAGALGYACGYWESVRPPKPCSPPTSGARFHESSPYSHDRAGGAGR